ncbi:MAG: diguanylate cyclase, partial [Micromonosporaceae bacterium]|nr:diguanylate cyclase [Micromonosporaceae bacterium]
MSRAGHSTLRGGDGHTAPLLGLRIPGLEIVEELGRGGQSVVYLARRKGADYALKVMRGPTYPEQAAMFRRGAALLAGLDHPGVARAYEGGEANGYPYVVMEYVAGHCLTEDLRCGVLPEDRILAVAIQIADALSAAHLVSLVHRDIKPDNIMITNDGSVKVLDFGMAGRTGHWSDDLAVGTLIYAAPEQSGGLNRPVDSRADLYSLGVTLYECLVGTPPFVANDAGRLVRMHVSATPLDIHQIRPAISPALAAVVRKLMAKDPDDRYQSAAGLREDLRRIAAGQREVFDLDTLEHPATDVTDPLIGREAELRTLLDHWESAKKGNGGVIVITGPQGCGKTRLVDELLATVTASGHTVLSAACRADSAVPMAPVRLLYDQYLHLLGQLAEPSRSASVDQVTQLAGSVPGGPGGPSEASSTSVPLVDEARDETGYDVVGTIARLLAGSEILTGGAVIHLADVHWADELTRRFLHQVAAGRPRGLLVVVTAWDEHGYQAALNKVMSGLGESLIGTVPLGPMPQPVMAALVARSLGTALTVPPAVLLRLVARSGGNPLTAREYLHALIDAGIVRPYWGTWLINEHGLEALSLPFSTVELLRRRVSGLPERDRRLLSVAALVGPVFTPAVAAAAAGVSDAAAAQVFALAASQQLIEPRENGYAFLHDNVRTVLISGLNAQARRATHQRIAEELERLSEPSEELTFESARHYLLGEPTKTPESASRAAGAAGALALRAHASEDAFSLLNGAVRVAEDAGMAVPAALRAQLGVAAVRANRLEVATDQLARALDVELDRANRAELFSWLAEARCVRLDTVSGTEAVRSGLAELGGLVPRTAIGMLLLGVTRFAIGKLHGLLPRRIRVSRGDRRRRDELRCLLFIRGVQNASVDLDLGRLVGFALSTRLPASRLGSGREVALARGMQAMALSAIGLRGWAERLFAEAEELAATATDPAVLAQLHWMRGMAHDVLVPVGSTDGHCLREALIKHGRWLRSSDYLTAVGLLAMERLLRGYAGESTELLSRAPSPVIDPADSSWSLLATVEVVDTALKGRSAEANAQLQSLNDLATGAPDNRVLRIAIAMATVMALVEQGEHGEALDRALDQFTQLGHDPHKAGRRDISFWISQALGRLATLAAMTTSDAGRSTALAAAARAVAQLGQAAGGPLGTAYHRLAQASLEQLRGHHRRALRRLARLEAWCGHRDLPSVAFEIARIRARAYRGLGHPADAHRWAIVAHAMALDYEWPVRARWIRSEFGIAVLRSTTSGGGGPAIKRGSEAYRRRMEALQEFSLAASEVFEPEEVARLALDEMVRVFGAERAFLFIEQDGQLRPYLGRDAHGTDLTELRGYGSTLVERVRASEDAIVLTGSEQGLALGSRSAVVHGLRSIMVAPLLLKDALIGVVYLDSRVAKGVFTEDDIDVLAAINSHVALSLGTAKAAQLELAFHAAQRQRDVAQQLHDAMVELTGSLDPDEVSRRLTQTVRKAVNVDCALVMRQGPDGGTIEIRARAAADQATAGKGPAQPAASGPERELVQPKPGGLVADLLELTEPARGWCDQHAKALSAFLGRTVEAWIAIPLNTREERHGVLLAVGTPDEGPCSDAVAEVAAALVVQGAVALENAQLFRKTQELADRDGLTGLYNRRHMFEEASQLFETPPDRRGSAAAIMIDIDQFKRINDTYGHSVGDEVIQAVARRLGNALRETDIICRYGGEEFAALLPATSLEASRLVAERLHRTISGQPISTSAGDLPVTV